MTPVFRQIAHRWRVTLYGTDMTRTLNQYDWLLYIEKVNNSKWIALSRIGLISTMYAPDQRIDFLFV